MKKKINISKLNRETLEKVANLFKIFADATRLQIIQNLKESPKNVSQLVNELGYTQANISKHLKYMHSQNLLNREQKGNSVYYSINDSIVLELCQIVCEKVDKN